MKRYKVIKQCSFAKVGDILETDFSGDLTYSINEEYDRFIGIHEIDMLIALGFIEEVKEENEKNGLVTEMPPFGVDYYSYVYRTSSQGLDEMTVERYTTGVNHKRDRFLLNRQNMFWDRASAWEALKEIMNS